MQLQLFNRLFNVLYAVFNCLFNCLQPIFVKKSARSLRSLTKNMLKLIKLRNVIKSIGYKNRVKNRTRSLTSFARSFLFISVQCSLTSFTHARLKMKTLNSVYIFYFLHFVQTFQKGKHLRCFFFPHLFAHVQTFQKENTFGVSSFSCLHFVQEISMLFSKTHRRFVLAIFFYRFFQYIQTPQKIR